MDAASGSCSGAANDVPVLGMLVLFSARGMLAHLIVEVPQTF